jgi:hypothetical protein
MVLHRTPVHHEVLRMVQGGRVKWRPEEKPLGKQPQLCRPAGFAPCNGGHLGAAVLVALWELHRAVLITVDGVTVSLTVVGETRLSEWDATRSGVQS